MPVLFSLCLSCLLDFTSWVDKTVNSLSTIFGWSKEALLGDEPLAIGRDASMVARFKMPASANAQYATAYTQYAYCLANLAAKCFQKKKVTVLFSQFQ